AISKIVLVGRKSRMRGKIVPVHCAVELPQGADHSSPASFQSYFICKSGSHDIGYSKRGWGRNRTADTWIFSPLLCQLSYPAVRSTIAGESRAFTMQNSRGCATT